jgi:hypothetical protein
MSVTAVRRDLVRSAEWHRVRDFAQQVPASPAVLAIRGEAGAGKSTLWRAGIETAAAAGHRLLRSEPSASETDLSFAALSDLLAEVLPLVGVSSVQLEALQIALLLRPAGDAHRPCDRPGGAGRTRALLSRQPVLIAIDDVQWLDGATQEVHGWRPAAVKRTASLLVAAYRGGAIR